ncbi:hypothetical protein NLJ89_g9318 [Agrocybe chaxingu]|uniref:Alpha/beta-hydrolase n=1 Tax=Agrocybe chaxingu TaxID=84603 RepID=A0A9W8JTK4_9AGAR|nr:hypothetical protein NLJ89_g9318 [Agrocybe chaxingu]
MQSILSRHNSTSQRTPRKSSSFLSLRREKDKAASSSPTASPYDSPGPSNTSPSSYFDVYPRPKSASTTRSAKSWNKRSSPVRGSPVHVSSPTSYHDPISTHADTAESPTYAFPSFDPSDTYLPTSRNPPLSNAHYSRTRSRTGPSGKSKWEPPSSAVPPLRFSNSSSTQHTETPPRTPDDYMASTDSLDNFPVVVAAPVAGVEFMDALVDGMNGGDIVSVPRASNRSRFGIPGHHPLYQPPLPTPPPGVVLGGGVLRKVSRKATPPDSSEDDEFVPTPTSRTRRRRPRPNPARSTSSSTITPPAKSYVSADEAILPTSLERRQDPFARPSTSASANVENRKSMVPSISEIIRNHTPPESQVRSRPPTVRSSSLYTPSAQGHATVQEEEIESEPEPLTREEEAELLSRSSIDSVADEVQRTIRNQGVLRPRPPVPPSSASAFINRYSTVSDNTSLYSPRSDPGAAPSIYSFSAPSSYLPGSPLDNNFLTMSKPNPSQAVAQYLRSARLTTLLRLTRSPHASQDNPLTVSLSDLGSPTGFPVVVFLGLGCVRHIMGLYDEMAECMNLRLITIDRWGLGRTEPRSKSAKGIMQWASVVEEVLDLLHIKECSIMAHSAGAPYALSFANKLPARIRGDICLLAPWVGGSENSGYRWLKYVPNSILKTAQAAEWKIQAWMIGKPPTIAYEGIGYTAPTVSKTVNLNGSSPRTSGNLNASTNSNGDTRSRPSIGSSTFSEYDDLGDFDGRFESRSTLGLGSRPASHHGHNDGIVFTAKRKTSRGIFERLKGSSTPPSQSQEKLSSTGKKLKALKSMGSLKGKSQSTRKSEPSSPQLPPALRIDVGLGLEDLAWPKAVDSNGVHLATATPRNVSGSSNTTPRPRSSGRRSISFTSSQTTPTSMPASPSPSAAASSFVQNAQQEQANHQVALGNALIAASHAESAKGTTNDLLQILNHENHSWGFSYSSYPHKVRVWYGDKDEKIAENAVRWMERTMGTDRCSVKVVKGADHGLMYRSSAVVDVLEWILSAWKTEGRFPQPYSGLH